MPSALATRFQPVIAVGRDESVQADPRSLSEGVRVLAVHFALYYLTLLGALAPLPIALNIASSLANGVFIALLFIIGHDGAHGAFVPSQKLNRWIARVAFVPCAHSASLWRIVHNKQHHGRTNLKGVDGVWAPMSKAEYDAASPARRWLERVYRGAFGPVIYYYLAFWIHRVLLPLAPEFRGQWKRHLPDSLFVVSMLVFTWASVLIGGKIMTPDRPLWLIFLLGWMIPFAIWNYLMAFTIYLNHTHPMIPWFNDEAVWSRYQGNLLDTASVRMPINIAPLYTKVMAHTAHHDNMKTPVYALMEAQSALNAEHSGLIEYTLTLGNYRKIYRACKLFDFERMCWTDFDGVPTS